MWSYLAACCTDDPPVWAGLDPLAIEPGERVVLDLGTYVRADSFEVTGGEGLEVRLDGAVLALLPDSGFLGETTLQLLAVNKCGAEATFALTVTVGDVADDTPTAPDCQPVLTYTAQGAPSAVYVAGTFNGWSTSDTPMAPVDGRWEATLDLPPGSYAYKFVEVGNGSQWACDPAASFAQCDEGTTWDPSCPLDGASCNSVVIVPDCDPPQLLPDRVEVDEAAGTLSVAVSTFGGAITETWATLDGSPVDGWADGTFTLDTTLGPGRHTLRVGASGPGGEAEPLYVPFWFDDRAWASGLLYYVFVDRFFDGDPTRNGSEGTSTAATDYQGGDWQGVLDKLDYLDDLGVTVLWLTAPQDNAEGAWGGLCNATYAGYHGYWPTDPTAPEEHFGDEALLHELVDEAHARGMRVLTDWVANHVHQDHPYYQEEPGWFNPYAICSDANNWNDIPETCWFAGYLPDLRYYDLAPLTRMVDDATWWVKEYDLDGYRVDAVKHMPHPVYFNFASRAREEIEWAEDFYTVGETFSGDRALIGAYVNDEELDGQFDFPLYWGILAAFAREEIGLSDGDGSLESVQAASAAAWPGRLMSTFLGNHDVARFLTHAKGEMGSLYGDGPCGGDGNLRGTAAATDDPTPYAKLALAWTYLLTTEGLPLVYYGDEIGLPGYDDPDNRQVMRFDSALSANETRVLDHVRTLGRARQDHPAMSQGTRTTWWGGEPGFYAYARTNGDDAVLVLLNRDAATRTVTNGLAFAGLSEGTWTDLLTGETFTSAGDNLSVSVPARGSRVLVR